MGNCNCDFLFKNDNEGETDMDKLKNSNYVNRPIEVKSNYRKINEKEIDKGNKLKSTNKIKNNLDQKLPEIGTYISLVDYNSFITQSIHNYIQNNKLDYENYLSPNVTTFAANPIKFKNNNIYNGNWNKDGEMEGYGIYYLNDRQIITEGVWNNGNIVFGRIFLSNGDIYEGEMKNSIPDGKGKLIFVKNKEKYIGDFKMGEMTGKGTFIFEDNTEYSGYIENGIFNGKGKMKWENGTEYTGDFVDSTLCGEGTITNIQNEKYEGNFDKNEFNGEGTYYFNNGDIYKGNFEYGIKKGNGTYTRNDNVIFEGNWNDDLPNGNGVITYSGNQLKGFWRNGAFVGSSKTGEENMETFSNIDKNIKPYKFNIFPSSLSHLAITDSNVSQYIPGKDVNFI
jgi:hypothetical protein